MEENKYKVLEYAKIEDAEIKGVVKINEPWDDAKDKKTIFFKEKIYKQLESNLYCPYCRCLLDRYKYNKSIDHIVNKNDYPAFTYQPKNLVITCRSCNTNKSDENVLDNSITNLVKTYEYNQYPFDKTNYSIIHPFLDDYGEHIEIWENLFYIPKNGSEKGKNTIKTVKLFRFELLERKTKSLLEGGPRFLKNAINNPSMDEAVSTWYELMLLGDDFKTELFKIIEEFEKYNYNKKHIPVYIIDEKSYLKLKEALQDSKEEIGIKFDYYVSSQNNFIKRINVFDSNMVDDAIEQLELLYKLRNYYHLFSYTLFIAAIFLIKKYDTVYNKRNLKKYKLID